jgi:hypothetical protein
MNLLKGVKRFYQKEFVESVLPEEPDHAVMMNIEIKKGETFGEVIVPCTLYTLNHAIDLNPSLIKKKTKEVIKNFKVGEKVTYNPDEAEIILTEEEKKRSPALEIEQLEEYESCPYCHQKAVIATVKQTRYRSCPKVGVELSSPAEADVVIPVQYGIRKGDIKTQFWMAGIIVGMIGFLWLSGLSLSRLRIATPLSLLLLQYTDILLSSLSLSACITLAFLTLFVCPLMIFRVYKTWIWYQSVKPTLLALKKEVG